MQIMQVTGNLELTAPEGYTASVLLKLVDHTTQPPEQIFVCWLVAGRYGAEAATVPFRGDGAVVVRIDVPVGSALSIDSLATELAAWWPNKNGVLTNPSLPLDPPVIKH